MPTYYWTTEDRSWHVVVAAPNEETARDIAFGHYSSDHEGEQGAFYLDYLPYRVIEDGGAVSENA